MATQDDYVLVHANLAEAVAPLDAPEMAGFVLQVDETNRLARSFDGFIAQPALQDEGAVFAPPFLLNVSLWKSIESLEAFTYSGRHDSALQRRAEWFRQGDVPNYVLYWAPKGHMPSEAEVRARLEHLRDRGPTAYAFTFDRPFGPDDRTTQTRHRLA
jgi:hypothetical protein